MVLSFIIGIFVTCGCVPRNSFLINSSGIATYNKQTGQFEILWETKNPQIVFIRDTVRMDSVSR